MTQISGSLVLITGGAQGIGRAAALRFADEGAKVIVADLDEEAAARTAHDCGGSSYRLDVGDRQAVAALAERIAEEHGVLDILVNNAGVAVNGPFEDTSLDDWEWIVGINYLGLVSCCHAFGPKMLEKRRGHIVNLSSGLAFLPLSDGPAYCSTKAAVLSFSQCLRAAWRPSGVSVSVICPGLINTKILDRARFRGAAAGDEQVAKAKSGFTKGHPPELVAKGILKAVTKDRAVMPVGAEAVALWWLNGLIPQGIIERIARRPQ